MIRSVSLRGFMNINDGRHAFAPGLNVIVAPNGAGGHNLLKLLCAVELEHEEAQGTLAFGFKIGSEFVSVDAMPSGTAPGRPVFIEMPQGNI